jgi:hypothetical protein
MKTIEELITIETEYINERLEGKENIDFVSILQENGLTSEQFQYQKGEYYLKTFNPIFIVGEVKLETENFELDRATKKKNSFICALPTQKIVWYPKNGEFDKNYCDANQIICKERPYSGGVLCILPTDLEVSIVASKAPITFPQVIINKVADWIRTKTTNEVIISGNDILIDGKKVLGMANYVYEDITVCGFHLAFDIDIDFIQKVCTKEMVKVPAGLNSFGTFDREELITEMMTWLK